jgi:hypothetical protein
MREQNALIFEHPIMLGSVGNIELKLFVVWNSSQDLRLWQRLL